MPEKLIGDRSADKSARTGDLRPSRFRLSRTACPATPRMMRRSFAIGVSRLIGSNSHTIKAATIADIK